MTFWTVALVLGIVAISWGAISQIVRISVKFAENVERIKHGYPTLNGDIKVIGTGEGDKERRIEMKKDDFIDMTENSHRRLQ